MPLDPEIAALLEAGKALPRTETLTPDAARTQYESRIAAMAKPAEIAGTEEITIPGPLRIRLYRPHGTGPFPLLVFFHGSGFVLCSLETHDGICRNLAAGAGCMVASVDYRLAPEHRFPTATDGCLAATRWLAENAARLGADPGRIAVGGDSAGGNLAAVTALRIRDEGGPALRGQLLMYPVTAAPDAGMPSYAENAEGYGLARATMEWFWGHYLADPARDGRHPHAAPLLAPDLSRLPPALVTSAEYDPLRDEAERYADRLRAAGVTVACTRWRGLNHGHHFWVGRVAATQPAMDEATGWLRAAFAGDPPATTNLAK